MLFGACFFRKKKKGIRGKRSSFFVFLKKLERIQNLQKEKENLDVRRGSQRRGGKENKKSLPLSFSKSDFSSEREKKNAQTTVVQ